MAKFKKTTEKPLSPLIQQYETVTSSSKGKILLNNFLGGIAWGMGTIVGITLLAVILSFLGKNVNLIPYIGDFIAEILKYLQLKNVV